MERNPDWHGACGQKDAAARPDQVSDPEWNLAGIASRQAAIPCKYPERKKGPVTMIAQVEYPRETDCCIPGFIPIALLILAVHQVSDAADDRGMTDLSRRHQGEQRPGRLG